MESQDREYWEIIGYLYESASELPVEDRKSYIADHAPSDEMKKELLSLLDVEDESTTYFNSLSEKLIEPAFDELIDLPPSSGKVNNYKILEKIGRGGMGSVYLAERCDKTYESYVAIKILRRGLDSEDILDRFKIERQILAHLNHPNITHLLDGGIASDGRPYFVMEYVKGKPITEYCNDNRLTIKERVKLFMKVCDAIAYAHQNLVIHRDLKPGNILVTDEGIVKLLDFGIAKLLDENLGPYHTITGADKRYMTPEYSSPEQVLGKQINTASDVYQLGLVLYKLLSDNIPFTFQNDSITERERVILEQLPDKPSQAFGQQSDLTIASDQRSATPERIQSEIKGDLDTIILKALHKDPDQRFSSVVEFKEDLLRYINGMPVQSRGDSLLYRSKKFINRNIVPVSVAGGFMLMLIIFGFFYNHSITEQRNQAQQEALKASQVTSFLIDLFEANDPALTGGEDLTAWELLEYGEERIEILEGQPEIQAQMYDVTGQIYRKIGEFEKSENLLNKALNLRTNLYGENHQETLSTYDMLGLLLSDQGRFSEADSLLRYTLKVRENSSQYKSPSTADTKSNLAYVLRRTGDYDEAEELYRSSLDIRRQAYGNKHELTIESMSSLGVTLLNVANYTEAENIFREVLDSRKELLGPVHPDLAMSYNNLGALLLLRGNFVEAIEMFEEALAMRKKLFDEVHPKIALTSNNLAIAYGETGEYEVSDQYLNEALSAREKLFGSDNVNTAISKFSYAQLKLKTEKPDEALYYAQTANNIFQENLSENHSFTARSLITIGKAYMMLGDIEIAGEYIEQGFRKVEEIHEENSLELALAQWDYAAYLFETDQTEKANIFAQQSIINLQFIEGPGSIRQAQIIEELSNYGTELLTDTSR